MGGWKATRDTVYVVRWPDGVVKVGYSYKQRWRRFVLRGAVVIALVEFENHQDAFAYERRWHTWLSALGRPAFDRTAAAVAYLGVDGGGYRECYRLADVDADALLALMRSHMPAHAPRHCP